MSYGVHSTHRFCSSPDRHHSTGLLRVGRGVVMVLSELFYSPFHIRRIPLISGRTGCRNSKKICH